MNATDIVGKYKAKALALVESYHESTISNRLADDESSEMYWLGRWEEARNFARLSGATQDEVNDATMRGTEAALDRAYPKVK